MGGAALAVAGAAASPCALLLLLAALAAGAAVVVLHTGVLWNLAAAALRRQLARAQRRSPRALVVDANRHGALRGGGCTATRTAGVLHAPARRLAPGLP